MLRIERKQNTALRQKRARQRVQKTVKRGHNTQIIRRVETGPHAQARDDPQARDGGRTFKCRSRSKVSSSLLASRLSSQNCTKQCDVRNNNNNNNTDRTQLIGVMQILETAEARLLQRRIGSDRHRCWRVTHSATESFCGGWHHSMQAPIAFEQDLGKN